MYITAHSSVIFVFLYQFNTVQRQKRFRFVEIADNGMPSVFCSVKIMHTPLSTIQFGKTQILAIAPSLFPIFCVPTLLFAILKSQLFQQGGSYRDRLNLIRVHILRRETDYQSIILVKSTHSLTLAVDKDMRANPQCLNIYCHIIPPP